jgi:Cu2+-exporting ATPase
LRLNFCKPYKQGRAEKNQTRKTKITIKEQEVMNKTLKIEGMMCGHCEMRVKKALEGIDGVKTATVDHVKGTAVVKLNKPVEDSVLKTAVEAQDYTVTGIE